MISIYLLPWVHSCFQSCNALTKRIAALETRMVQAILRLCVRLRWFSIKLHCGTVLWENFLSFLHKLE